MTTTLIEDLWLLLRREAASVPIPKGSMQLRRINDENRLDIYAGLDESLCCLLAIGLHQRPSPVLLRSSTLQCFRRQRADKKWLQVLRLNTQGLEGVFGRLCQDLVDEAQLVESEAALSALFNRRLHAWQKLFELSGNGLLSLEKIRGMIAELSVMEELVNAGQYSLATIAGSWMGPLGHEQDFCLPDQNLEVKAIRPTAKEVQIASLRQLASEQKLLLEILPLEDATADSTGSVNLNMLTARLEGRMAPDQNALKIFRDRLLEAGYVEQPGYEKFQFLVGNKSTYLVSDKFPRLTPSTVDEGISKASYSLTLDSLTDFIITQSPSNE